jgi:hypothetical protein
MSETPVAAPRTEGRIFGTDWSIANVARLLRANAGQGVWRHAAAAGGSNGAVNQYYLRTVSAHHLPSGASLIFMSMEKENTLATDEHGRTRIKQCCAIRVDRRSSAAKCFWCYGSSAVTHKLEVLSASSITSLSLATPISSERGLTPKSVRRG